MKNDIQLGATVTDIVTGFTGIALHSYRHMNGNMQYAVQPKCKEGASELPSSLYIDDHTLQVTVPANGIAKKPAPHAIELGMEVEDLVTGFRGTVTHELVFLNGCVHFLVSTKLKGPDKDASEMQLSIERLKVLGPGVTKRIKVNKEDPTGGPMSSVKRMAVARG